MQRTAVPAEIDRGCASRVVIVFIGADQFVHQQYAPAAMGFIERLPETAIIHRGAAAGAITSEVEVLQTMREVMLATSGAGATPI